MPSIGVFVTIDGTVPSHILYGKEHLRQYCRAATEVARFHVALCRYIGVDAMDRNIDLAVQMQGTVPAWNFYNINFLRDDLPTADLLISRAALLVTR